MNQGPNAPQPPQYRQPPQQQPQYGQGQPPQQFPQYGQPSPYGYPPQQYRQPGQMPQPPAQYGQMPQPPQQYAQSPQFPPQYGQAPTTGIRVHASFFPLAFLFFFCTPTIVIDGQVHRGRWYEFLFFPLAPGVHTIKIFFRYLWMAECGANSAQILVEPGRVLTIKYYMPPWAFAAGSIKQEQTSNIPQPLQPR